jgi:hypothetical protein
VQAIPNGVQRRNRQHMEMLYGELSLDRQDETLCELG